MSEYDPMPREFGWDDEIQNDSNPFQVLPEGDYNFTVKKFERARHSGSAKIPACNKAILTISVFNGEASGEVQTNLFLHSKFEWKLCQFFVSIGQRKRGEAAHMNWSAVPGSSGVCHVCVRKWMGNDSKERESNEITEFYAPENAPQVSAARTPQAAAAQEPVQTTAPGWSELPASTPTPWSTGSF